MPIHPAHFPTARLSLSRLVTMNRTLDLWANLRSGRQPSAIRVLARPRCDVIQHMTHLSRDALARYLTKSDSKEERIGVDWHLEHCAICKQEITVRDVALIARDARERLVAAVPSAERN